VGEASDSLIEHSLLLAVSIALCWPAYGMWVDLLFGSKHNAGRKLHWFLRRDGRSLMTGEYTEDKFAEVRWGFVVGLSALTVAAVYAGLSRFSAWLGA
jgi:hypothetical protein